VGGSFFPLYTFDGKLFRLGQHFILWLQNVQDLGSL